MNIADTRFDSDSASASEQIDDRSDSQDRDGSPTVLPSRERILVAAARLFQEHGYAGTSIASIAKEVGMTAPALYWHFTSKAQILFEFLRSTLTAFIAEIEAGLVDVDDPRDQLRRLAEGHTRSQLRQLDVAVAYGDLIFSTAQLSTSLEQDQIDELLLLRRRYVNICRDIVSAGVDAGHFKVDSVATATMAIINICEYVTTWFKPGGALSMDDVVTMHGEFAIRMVGCLAEVKPPSTPVRHHDDSEESV